MEYIKSMPKEEVRALIESGVPCYHKYGAWETPYFNGGVSSPGQISKEKALELLPRYNFGGMWAIIIPEDKSFVKFVEPSDSDLW